MQYRKKFWEIFAIGMALAMAVFTYFLPLPMTEDSISYMLSALSQGLAAIFTLVFTLTIFGAQMMRNYTAMDRMIDNWTKILMVIFSIGIILPLVQLRTDKDLLNLNLINTEKLILAIDLGVVTFCILAIIPYLIRVNRNMKFSGGVPKICGEAAEAIDSNLETSAINKIYELTELAKSSIDDGLIHETSNIIERIHNLGINVVSKEWEYATLVILKSMREIGFEAINKKLDSNQISIVVEDTIIRVSNIGEIAIDKYLSSDTFSETYGSMIECSIKLLDKNYTFIDRIIGNLFKKKEFSEYEDTVSLTLKKLIGLTNKACRNNAKKYESDLIILAGYLLVLGTFINKYLPEYSDKMVKQLNNLDVLQNNDLLKDNSIRINAIEYLENYKNCSEIDLERFLKFYDEKIKTIST